jgi:anhydro-N-acetylmuramic acid kinase
MNEQLFIGILSGTSLDQIDAGLFRFAPSFCLVDQISAELPPSLRHRLQRLIQNGEGQLREIGQLDAEIGLAFAEICQQLIKRHSDKNIAAIGSHGINLWHEMQTPPYFTWQIGDPHRVAEITNLPVIADFRRRDVATGGQGAPLASGFHRWFFLERQQKENIAIVNLGGIANVTFLSAEKTLGFDTGPANGLLDAWIQKEKNLAYDANGDWAAAGRVNNDLLAQLLDDPYFGKAPPKSTGKEYFSLAWLAQKLGDALEKIPPADMQATLSALTAQSIARAIKDFLPTVKEIYLCGGGVHNRHLRQQLAQALPHCTIDSTAVLGLAPEWVEAATFAWLAHRYLEQQPGNLPSVTGAKRAVVLGSYFPKSC